MSAATSPVVVTPGRAAGVGRRLDTPRPTLWSWVLVAAVAAYLLLPGHPLSLLRGVPLDPLGLGALLGLAIGLFGFGLPRGWHRA